MPHEKQDRDAEEIEDEGKNIILGIVSQLRPNMDLSKVTFPTFVLEPKSMLERITNFMSHPDLLLNVQKTADPEMRFLDVVRFYMSGWHIRPRGVKKPLNPILGETFTGFWKFPPSNSKDPNLQKLHGIAVYAAEQVCHHPPISAYFYLCPEYKVRIDGVVKPRSRFLGNSAASIMEGIASIKLQDLDEEYLITQPNVYARGILFGKMRLELGDHVTVRCPKTDLQADIEFKVKGFISGTYNSIAGKVKRVSTGEVLYKISGKWDSEMSVESVKTGETRPLLDVSKHDVYLVSARPLEEQGERESQRLWYKTCQAVIARDQTTATETKSAIEDRQREEAKQREIENVQWKPKYFKMIAPEEYILNFDIPNGKSDLEVLCALDEFIPIFSEVDRIAFHKFLSENTKPEDSSIHKHSRDASGDSTKGFAEHMPAPARRRRPQSTASFVTYRSDNGSVDEYHDAQLPDPNTLSKLHEEQDPAL
ncbi:Oxysterol binding protein [Schizosaccharomyces pombe]|uniref:Oxysterol-binding protein homolog C23B6.01c n=1 Tax=Schizosaccharomyces pombe (strain 972 / ATCC 24843) TaxID=284812 RepID=YJX1_SCHPO|nr:putative oxysterol binding protein [Schizosaccharomyces pombe]Q9UUA1.2 RecName: Full=Oxysterol-binding protein homolog C23B6.01c [Schizosaccharomyces pombe 972h-]CAB51560.2 oxysterol binding protein (predicted) [Schizosaccharomyces pombe]|eukprot:NP_588124.2 putative oxysterol binding protein [Schizosaccharomyces pombe]